MSRPQALTLLAPLLLALSLAAGPLRADARLSVLSDLMRLSEVARILHDEGLAAAEDLNQDMLEGQGGPAWQQQVAAIYNPARIMETLRGALESGLSPDHIAAASAFFSSETGARVVRLENEARRAIADPGVEAAARARFAEAQAADDPRLARLRAFAEAGEMVERNVATALNSNLMYLRGLSEGGAVDMSEQEMLDGVRAQADAVREDTEAWLMGYFLLAFSPLSDDELQAYIDFSATDAGQALNAALFNGFGMAYEDISFALGRAVALNMRESEL